MHDQVAVNPRMVTPPDARKPANPAAKIDASTSERANLPSMVRLSVLPTT
jgi:hypothetical protein